MFKDFIKTFQSDVLKLNLDMVLLQFAFSNTCFKNSKKLNDDMKVFFG